MKSHGTNLRRSLAALTLAAIVSIAGHSQHGVKAPNDAAALIGKRPPWQTQADWSEWNIQLCQALGPAAPCPTPAVDCSMYGCSNCPNWGDKRMVGFQEYAQGEYVGRARLEHVPEYRLRVDDELEFIYRLTRDETNHPYLINVGDEIRVESFTDPNLDRTLIVQPDGTVTLKLLGEVKVARRSVTELRQSIDELYKKYYKVPSITVTPIRVNTKLEDLRATIDARAGQGGQRSRTSINPEGTVSLPAVGTVPAQGLSLRELKRELDERYAAEIDGIEVTPVLIKRAARYVYVLGEVRNPGRYTLEGPTTVMQAIATAGSWYYGGDVRHIVIMRRTEDWHLQATQVDLRAAMLGKEPCPQGEIWVSDSDVIIVPKAHILMCNHDIELFFTNGIYRILPFTTSASVNWSNMGSTIVQ